MIRKEISAYLKFAPTGVMDIYCPIDMTYPLVIKTTSLEQGKSPEAFVAHSRSVKGLLLVHQIQ